MGGSYRSTVVGATAGLGTASAGGVAGGTAAGAAVATGVVEAEAANLLFFPAEATGLAAFD